MRGVGRTVFAAVLLLIGGVLNIVWGIAAISNAHFFTHNTHYIFASLNGWGWVSLILGIFELIAGASLIGGGTYGRWFGVLAGSLVAIESLFSIPSYPLLVARGVRPQPLDHPWVAGVWGGAPSRDRGTPAGLRAGCTAVS